MMMWVSTNGAVRIGQQCSTTFVESANTVSPSASYEITYTYDKINQQAAIYIDGFLEATDTLTLAGANFSPVRYTVGSGYHDLSGELFSFGVIDRVTVDSGTTSWDSATDGLSTFALPTQLRVHVSSYSKTAPISEGLVIFGSALGNSSADFYCYINDAGKFAITQQSVSGQEVVSTTVVAANKRYDVTFAFSLNGPNTYAPGDDTVSGPSTATIFVDGTAEASVTVDWPSVSTPMQALIGTVTVGGGSHNSTPAELFDFSDGSDIRHVEVANGVGQYIQDLYQHSATESSFYAEEIYPQMLATAWNLHFAATVRTLHMTCQHTC